MVATTEKPTLAMVTAELVNGGAAFDVGDGRKLCEFHRRELMEGSGLTAETIRAAGIYTETDHKKIADLLNWKSWPSSRGAAMVFPLADGVFQVKPMNPRTRKGKLAKYEAPSGGRNRAYIPPAVRAVVDDESIAICFTEGAKKSLAASQHGFATIAVSGVENWHPKKSSALIADLQQIKLAGRAVYIAFDSDAIGNADVLTAEAKFAAALTAAGATVRIIRLPPGPNGEKQGLDDYLVAHGPDALRELITNAEEPDPGALAAVDDDEIGFVKLLADLITADNRFARDLGGKLYRYSDGTYKSKAEQFIRAEVKRLCNDLGATVKWSTKLANETVEYIAVDAPELWERPPLDVVNVANGLATIGRCQALAAYTRTPIAGSTASKV